MNAMTGWHPKVGVEEGLLLVRPGLPEISAVVFASPHSGTDYSPAFLAGSLHFARRRPFFRLSAAALPPGSSPSRGGVRSIACAGATVIAARNSALKTN